MLILKNIEKEYTAGDTSIKALKNISIDFREKEFVSILGPPGCGKESLLNIIAGLERYTSGDLSINGKSTNEFSDTEWDTYRSNYMGYVSSIYSLMPHWTVLDNVELALILSGVSRNERRENAASILKKVKLSHELCKKPYQLTCDQMRCTEIARALVKNPDIILIDEPDLETSVQVMEILKEVSKEKLVIMATDNLEIAEKYSSRIINLAQGKVIDDSNPYHVVVEKPFKQKKRKILKKTNMSFFTAFSLSVKRLMTNKARFFLILIMGSIGITVAELILSLSSKIQSYIPIALAICSLLTSSIVISMGTCISVFERAKEIAILHCIGALRKDISRVFNIETFIYSFAACAAGVINFMIIKNITCSRGINVLSSMNGTILIISMVLNLITGLFTSRIAAKKIRRLL